MTTLGALPTELQFGIFTRLSILDLVSVSAVSHQLRAVSNCILRRRLEKTSRQDFGLQICPPSEKTIAPYHLCRNKGAAPLPPKTESLSDIYTHLIPTFSHSIFGTPVDPLGLPEAQNLRRTLILEGDEYFTQQCIGLLLIKLGGEAGGCMFKVFSDGWFRIRRADMRAACKLGRQLMVWVDQGRNVGVRLKVLAEEEHEPEHIGIFGSPEWGSTGETVGFRVEFTGVMVKALWLASMLEVESNRGFL